MGDKDTYQDRAIDKLSDQLNSVKSIADSAMKIARSNEKEYILLKEHLKHVNEHITGLRADFKDFLKTLETLNETKFDVSYLKKLVYGGVALLLTSTISNVLLVAKDI